MTLEEFDKELQRQNILTIIAGVYVDKEYSLSNDLTIPPTHKRYSSLQEVIDNNPEYR